MSFVFVSSGLWEISVARYLANWNDIRCYNNIFMIIIIYLWYHGFQAIRNIRHKKVTFCLAMCPFLNLLSASKSVYSVRLEESKREREEKKKKMSWKEKKKLTNDALVPSGGHAGLQTAALRHGIYKQSNRKYKN